MPFIQSKLIVAFPSSSRGGLFINKRIAQLVYQRQLASFLHTTSSQQRAPRISASVPSFIIYETQRRALSITQPRTMAGDEDYMDFLSKAWGAPEGSAAAAARRASRGASRRVFKTEDEGSELPKSIADLSEDVFYVTEADEPFVGVSLKWEGEGGLPDEVEFAKLIHHWDAENAQIDIMDPTDWDSQGQYANIIEAVREATRGNDVRVYRVARDLTRAEYWVISRDDRDNRIVGMKALGIES